MNDLTLRCAEARDLPRLCRIWALSFGDEEALVRKILCDELLARTVVCDDSGQAAGLMTAFDGLCFAGKRTSYLYALCTHPDHRGRGIGRALTRESARLAFARGAELVCLHPANPQLAAWYERMGFVPAAAPAWEAVLPQPCPSLRLTALDAGAYAERRKAFTSALPLSLLRVQELFCGHSGGGLYAAEWQGNSGLVCAERNGRELMLREVLCEGALRAALATAVTGHLGADRGWYHGSGEIAAAVSPPHLMFSARAPGMEPARALLPFLLD